MWHARTGGTSLLPLLSSLTLPSTTQKGLSPMNILTISAQKPDSTGSGVYLAETVRGFERLGHRVQAVCGVDVADEPFVSEACRLHTVRFNTAGLPFPVVGMSDVMPYASTRYRDLTPAMVEQFKAAFAVTVGQAVREAQPDLVICHHLYLLTTLVAQMGLACPVVAVCHNTDLRQMRSHGLERDFIRAGIQRLDGILALHDAQIPEIAQVYGVDPARIRVVGTGYNDAVFYPVEGLREPGLTRVVYAGKIARAKGVHSLLACLGRLPFAPRAFGLRMAGGHGSPEEYQEAGALAEKAPYPVTFEGKLCQPDLARLYNASDVFVLPSFCEGLPLVVVEALACGCKVVVTDLPGLRPWIDSQMPGAPVVYVAPPRMAGPDEPVAQDLPGFEERLAAALVEAAEMPQPTAAQARACTGSLSWTSLAERMLTEALR